MGDSLRRQNELIDKYTKEKKLELDSEFRYTDMGISAFRGENIREGMLGKFLECIRDGMVAPDSVLLVESLDRITRMKTREALPLFLDIINAGVTIVTLIDGREHSAASLDKDGDMMLYGSLMVLSRAHEESKTKSERLKRAWEQKRKDISTKFYTNRVPSWVKVSEKQKFETIPEKAKIIKRMFKLLLDGDYADGIAKLFHKEEIPIVGGAKVWSHSFVFQTLRNPAVTGEFTPHKIVDGKRVPASPSIPDFYPEVISKDVFNRTQSILDSRSRKKKGGRISAGGSHLFRKVLYCGYCGEPVYRTTKGRYYKGELRRTLVCRRAKEGTGCFYIAWEYKEFEEAFLTAATELRQTLSGKYDGKPLRKELNKLNGEKMQIDKKLSNLVSIVEAEGAGKENSPKIFFARISEHENRLEEIEKEIQATENRLAAGMQGNAPLVKLETLMKKLENEDARKQISDLISQMFTRIDLFPAGTKFDFAKLKSLHAKLVRARGKADGSVSVQIREQFDRRKVRFFRPRLNHPGADKRLTFSSDGRMQAEQRLDLVDDLPEDAVLPVVI